MEPLSDATPEQTTSFASTTKIPRSLQQTGSSSTEACPETKAGSPHGKAHCPTHALRHPARSLRPRSKLNDNLRQRIVDPRRVVPDKARARTTGRVGAPQAHGAPRKCRQDPLVPRTPRRKHGTSRSPEDDLVNFCFQRIIRFTKSWSTAASRTANNCAFRSLPTKSQLNLLSVGADLVVLLEELESHDPHSGVGSTAWQYSSNSIFDESKGISVGLLGHLFDHL